MRETGGPAAMLSHACVKDTFMYNSEYMQNHLIYI